MESDASLPGDMTDYKATITTTGQPSAMRRLHQILGHIDNRPIEADKEQADDLKRAITRGGTLRRLKETFLKRLVKEEEQIVLDLEPLEESLETPLEQLHFIIGFGILKPALRDEIYCQTCRQLIKNPYKSSLARGWLLLSLLVGCFPPSISILKYIIRFLEDGPPLYTVTCKRNLQRTLNNGARCQPPAFIELEAALNKRLLDVSVTLMDGTMHTMGLDAATTSHELCSKLSEFLGLRDQFGFSIYIAMYNKVASLSNSNDRILDAISRCEQLYRETEHKEGPAPWRLFYRKEIFSPWENAGNDWVAAGLVFSQVVRGIMLGEYRCDSDQQLAVLAAQQYYIEYGSDISDEGLTALLPSYIPQANMQGDNTKRMWRRAVIKAHKKLFDVPESARMPQEKVKQEVVNMAKNRWPVAFSRYYDVIKLEGPNWPNGDLSIAVNCKGLTVLSNGKRISNITFSDILEVSDGGGHVRDPPGVMVLMLVSGAAMKLCSGDGDELRRLVSFMLNGLKQRSTYAIVVENCDGEEEGQLAADTGDLVVLGRQAGLEALTSETCVARNERTGAAGGVHTAHIYVLPTLCRPTDTTLKMFRSHTHAMKPPKETNSSEA